MVLALFCNSARTTPFPFSRATHSANALRRADPAIWRSSIALLVDNACPGLKYPQSCPVLFADRPRPEAEHLLHLQIACLLFTLPALPKRSLRLGLEGYSLPCHRHNFQAAALAYSLHEPILISKMHRKSVPRRLKLVPEAALKGDRDSKIKKEEARWEDFGPSGEG